MAGDHWAKREQCNFAAWIKPKAAHNRFVNEILQTKRAPDLCFCAREAEARQGQEQQDRASAAGLAADLHGRTGIRDDRSPDPAAEQPRHAGLLRAGDQDRSEEHTSELQSLMRISYAV